jgi:hypothetical protein
LVRSVRYLAGDVDADDARADRADLAVADAPFGERVGHGHRGDAFHLAAKAFAAGRSCWPPETTFQRAGA